MSQGQDGVGNWGDGKRREKCVANDKSINVMTLKVIVALTSGWL
jgi:hypothetical protein